jgi:hypothetical protein
MAKIASKGTAFKWTISSVLTAIAAVTTVESGDGTTGFSDVTSLDGSVGREFLPNGYEDAGEPKISGFLDPAAATHKALTTDQRAQTSRAASIVWSDSAPTSWTFTAYVKSFKGNAAEGQPLKFDSTFRSTGITTYPT